MGTEIHDASETDEGQPVMYEELAALEQEFDDVDVEILRKQTLLLTPLYAKRALLTARIPHFWALVLEQAPPDIDAYIQPSDSEVLTTALTNISVERFEVASGPAAGAARASASTSVSTDGNGVEPSATAEGDPRSVLIRFEFAPNAWFEDAVLEKRFWYRRARDGWAGLVSEPVGIRWKAGRDLTRGLGGAAGRLWEAERKILEGGGGGKGQEGRKALREYKELLEKLESSAPGAQSFFAWFAFRGRGVGAEESVVAKRVEGERRARAGGKEGKGVDGGGKVGGGGAAEEDLEEEEEDECEVFPLGDELAISIAEDLWPGAIKYFTQAQEQDDFSEADFEDDPTDDDEDGSIPNLRGLVGSRGQGATGIANEEDEDEDKEERRPKKKVRT